MHKIEKTLTLRLHIAVFAIRKKKFSHVLTSFHIVKQGLAALFSERFSLLVLRCQSQASLCKHFDTNTSVK